MTMPWVRVSPIENQTGPRGASGSIRLDAILRPPCRLASPSLKTPDVPATLTTPVLAVDPTASVRVSLLSGLAELRAAYAMMS